MNHMACFTFFCIIMMKILIMITLNKFSALRSCSEVAMFLQACSLSTGEEEEEEEEEEEKEKIMF